MRNHSNVVGQLASTGHCSTEPGEFEFATTGFHNAKRGAVLATGVGIGEHIVFVPTGFHSVELAAIRSRTARFSAIGHSVFWKLTAESAPDRFSPIHAIFS